MKHPWAVVVSLALLLVFIAQALVFVHANSQTYDEAAYLAAGYAHLKEGDFTWMPEHPPLNKELSALPVLLRYSLPFPTVTEERRQPRLFLTGQLFLHAAPVPAMAILASARLPNVGLGIMLVALVGWWSYRRWGLAGGLVGLTLAVFEPTLLAHSSLATTDLSVTLFGGASLYFLWEYLQTPRWSFLVLCGLMLGLALVCKFSGALTGVIIALLLGLSAWDESLQLPGRNEAGRPLLHRLLAAVLLFVLILVTAALVIPPVYRFQGYHYFLDGLAFQFKRTGTQPAFLLGQLSNQGWLGYFGVALLLKLPLGILALVAGSLLLRRVGTPLQRRDLLFFVFPALLILGAISLTRVNLGIRYVLPIYPFLLVLAARLATATGWPIRSLVGLCVVGTVLSSLACSGQQLAYFNELCGGPAQGFRYLSDSNLDWGQDLLRLRRWQEEQGNPRLYLSCFGTAPPESYGIDYQLVPPSLVPRHTAGTGQVPEEGRQYLVVSAVFWQGLYLPDPDRFHWLRTRTPIARPGWSLFVYDLTEDTDGHWQLARLYRRQGMDEHARLECRKVLRLDPKHEAAQRLLQSLTKAPASP